MVCLLSRRCTTWDVSVVRHPSLDCTNFTPVNDTAFTFRLLHLAPRKMSEESNRLETTVVHSNCLKLEAITPHHCVCFTA